MEARRKPHNHDLGFAGNSHTTRQPLGESESGSGGQGGMGKGGRAEARHEALPHTSPGGSPLRPPAPFPSALIREPIGAVKGSQAVHSHALDSSDRFPTPSLYDGKGA